MRFRNALLLALVAKAAGMAALAINNRRLELDDLPPTLPGRMHDWQWHDGRVRYTTLGERPPLVLLHGLDAAASSFEWRSVFEPLAARFAVFAPDLLGFGKSERPALTYSGEQYVDLVSDFLAEVVERPCAVVASSLSSAYAVVAAVRRRELVDRLVLICPTGAAAATASETVNETIYWFLRLAVQGRAASNAMVSRRSIRAYLERRVYADRSFVTEQLVNQNWATAHQPNARYAPAAFIGGRLSYPWRPYLMRVTQPTLLVWGSEARLTPLSDAAELQVLNPEARLHVFERCGALPQDEVSDAFLRAATQCMLG